MLIELGVVEQRHRAVLEVMEGLSVTEVAGRYGVTRQTVHRWLRWYARGGIAALADGSHRPATCPHRMAPEVEARIVALRSEHPGWGPRTLLHYLAREELSPLPGRSSVHRCLLRHGLIEPHRRRRKREDYRRWERLRAMELWQMDVMGGVRLAGGGELKIITGIDDHSRFCVCAQLTPRATARPVCEAFLAAMRRHGAPEQVLTDNGKVFTARFGRGKGMVLFDRICHENGIRHLLTAPRSPTTTGKVERFHKTVRSEFLAGRTFASLEEAQTALDEWVNHYNAERPHQGIGMTPPLRRFELAAAAPEPVAPLEGASEEEPPELRPLTRLVSANGTISFEAARYHAGAWLAGEAVELTLRDGLLEIAHRGVLVACHAHRHVRRTQTPTHTAPRQPRPHPAPPLAAGPAVKRKVDPTGYVSFAGRGYFVGNRLRGEQVEVRLAGDAVQISQRGVLLKTHVARHDRSKEHGAFSTPQGRPHRSNASRFSREVSGTDQPEPNWNAGGGT